MDERARLDRYLRDGREIVGNDGYPPLPRFAALVRRLLPARVSTPVRRVATNASSLLVRRRVPKVQARAPLRLHLGSGRFHKDGWVNVDLLGAPVDLPWDLMRRLPFDEGCADAVFHEHLLEHLSLEQGYRLTTECHRVLKPGGVLRIGVPDADAYLRSYAGQSDFVQRTRPGRPTALLAVQEVFYRHGHRTMYDFETLAFLCRAAGFSHVERSAFGESRIQPSPDGEHRRSETLYVEAVKR